MKNSATSFSVILVALLLAGCGEMFVKGSPGWKMNTTVVEQRDYYIQQCVLKGIKLNTPEMEICIQAEPSEYKDQPRSNPFAKMMEDSSDDRYLEKSEYEQRERTNCIRSGGVYGGAGCFYR